MCIRDQISSAWRQTRIRKTGCPLSGSVVEFSSRRRRVQLLEHGIEKLVRLGLIHTTGIHQLAGQDLLRPVEHLFLTSGKTFLRLADRKVPHYLGQLEDVAGLDLLAVVLE